jgi:decaprenylphospho-beta-D-ribofuranose 2-oxidase
MTTAVAAGSERRLLTGWGRTAPSSSLLVRPADAASVEALLAESSSRGAIARGLGRSYGDAAQNGGGRTVSMRGLRGLHAFDPATGVLHAAAGMSLGEVAELTVPAGWFPRVVPGTRHVTLGGALAADVHGKNHHRDGGFAASVRSARIATPALGTVTVRPGDELFAATAGGMGLTGIVLDVELQLVRVQTAYVEVRRRVEADIDAVMAALEAGDRDHRYSVAWIDLLARGSRLGRGLVDLGDHAAPDALPAGARDRPLEMRVGRGATAPRVPVTPLRRPLVAAGNALRHRLGRPGAGVVGLAAFFHPLDRVELWSRAYGPRGLVQYQFAVPAAAAATLVRVAEEVGRARAPVFLAVLKRFGGEGEGLLSFPLPGWTLALDLPAAWPPVAGLLDRLDDLVAAAGGRVYLAKDGRMRPGVVEAMYPRLQAWREAVLASDPGGVLQSDLGRRLDLRGGGA